VTLGARGVPFVFSTGYDKGRLLEGYRTFTALQKPFRRSQLVNALAKLLTPKESSVESVIAAADGRNGPHPESAMGQTAKQPNLPPYSG
jgi:hypothetical protein